MSISCCARSATHPTENGARPKQTQTLTVEQPICIQMCAIVRPACRAHKVGMLTFRSHSIIRKYYWARAVRPPSFARARGESTNVKFEYFIYLVRLRLLHIDFPLYSCTIRGTAIRTRLVQIATRHPPGPYLRCVAYVPSQSAGERAQHFPSVSEIYTPQCTADVFIYRGRKGR